MYSYYEKRECNYTPTQSVETVTVSPTETTTENQTVKMTVTATAYCPCEKCCGKWAENRNGVVLTASGTQAAAGRTLAVDKEVFPFGTVIIIDGKEYVAEDTGSAVKGNMIDIYFETHEQAQQFGKRQIEIEVKQ